MGRSHKSFSTFNAHDSNTHCDVTGFKVKRSEVQKRWDGFYVIPEAFHPRQPQDFPVIPTKQKVVKDVRIEDLTTESVSTFEKI
jgi:hypothetical protein